MRQRKVFVFVIAWLSLVAVVSGCAKKGERKAPHEDFEIEREYRRGPTSFTVRVSEGEITIADRIRLALEVRSKEEYEVQLPEFGEHLEHFGVVDYRAPSPQLVGDGVVVLRKSYELEPFLSGEYKIPPMKVFFWKRGEQDESKHEVESEEVTIVVKSLLPEQAADLAIRDIVPPVELPTSARPWLYVVIGTAVLGAGGVGGFLLWRRHRTSGAEVLRRPAHEIAYEALESLLAEKLLDKGRVKPFYFRLSLILRYYIENRFGLSAPERTTEEFLADLGSTDVLASSHKHLLKGFMKHCDVVKFAEHRPTNQEIQSAFDACKRFIVETEVSRGADAVGAAAENRHRG
jgi:hypothetical protein